MSVFSQNISTIDPENCQLVEVPVDTNGAIVVQDPSGLIAAGQMQSVLDPRVSQGGQRGARAPTRKPLGPAQGLQVLQGAQLVPQSAVIAPAASGLLSLGTRYTPSSGIPLNIGTGTGASAGIINSQGNIFTSTGGAMVTSAGAGDRDVGYRFATVGGASNRGRPRGRRPLRGQFPVVPIDMVRQLGIEQQVILQPAAPVAMRNKAILCRPLSVSRKTQACINSRNAECQFSADEEALASKHEEDIEDDEMMVVEEASSATPSAKKDVEDDVDLIGEVDEDEILSEKNDFDVDVEKKKAVRQSEAGANTETLRMSNLGTQTDVARESESSKARKVKAEVKYVPVPIPVPIYVPVPVFAYARPVPFVLPFPLPCGIPLPFFLPGEKEPKTDGTLKPAADGKDTSTEQKVALKAASAQEESETSIASKSHSQKRTAKETASSSGELSHPPSKRSRRNYEAISMASLCTGDASGQSCGSLAPSRRTPISDANYHLKFSYGINAWRLWVAHTAQSRTLTELVDIPDKQLNLALTRFVREVRKPNNETYVADSIFYLCLGIQEFLNENGRTVNIFGEKFNSFVMALDTVLADFQPRVSPEGMLICRIEEEHMWEAKQLGDHNPHVLLFTILYFITKHMWLRTGEQHAQLLFSNFKLKHENPSSECVLFVPGSGSDSYRLFATAESPSRCPVRLFRAYLKKCPPSLVSASGAFYLTPQSESSSASWYSGNAIPASQLQVMLNRIKMVKEIQEAFMDSPTD